MNILDAKAVTLNNIHSGNATLWQSGSGLGKSSVAFQLFCELRDEAEKNGETMGFGVIFAATQTPPDIIGIPFKGSKTYNIIDYTTGQPIERTVTITDASIPLWMMMSDGRGGPMMPAFCFDKCFLLIDEYGQGDGEVKRSMAEIFLNGGTSPWYLPAGSVRIACTNVGTRYGVTKDFDFCIARRSVVKIEGDIKITLDHMDKPYKHQGKTWQTTPEVKTWAAQNAAIVFEQEPKEQGPWCNPRQLLAVDRYLQTAWQTSGNKVIQARDISMIAGTIGVPATESLVQALQFALDLPQYDDVIADPMGTPVPTRADLQMMMAYMMASHCTPKDLAAAIQYIQRMPSDMGVTFICALLRRDYKGIMNQPAMQAWLQKNATLVAIVSSLAIN